MENEGKQGFHYDTKELFEPITKTVSKTGEILLEETRATLAAIENVITYLHEPRNSLVTTRKIFKSI